MLSTNQTAANLRFYLERKQKEWLYPLPDFLSSRPPYRPMQEEVRRLERHLSTDLNDRTDDVLQEDLAMILRRGVERWRVFKESRGGREAFSIYPYNVILVDIGQHRRNDPSITWCDAAELDSQLRQVRKVEKAKKRFQCVYLVNSGNTPS